MLIYGGREMAEAFRTVRKNTITIADEIGADQYGFRPAPESRTVAELLAHMAMAPMWQADVHGAHLFQITYEMFGQRVASNAAAERALASKDSILQALRDNGDRFAAFLAGVSDDTLAELVSFPPPVQPSTKSRFEMLLGVKEHEMHHRGQLMVYQRILGMVPHLTRARQPVSVGR